MSYSRWGWEGSDVYVYMDVRGKLCCCGCRYDGEDLISFYACSTQDMVAHLLHHEALGAHVPPGIYDELWRDDAENYPKEATDDTDD